MNPQGEAPKKEVRIQNDVVDQPRTGSGLKVDAEKTIFDSKTGKVIKEFPATAKSHGFSDIIDNYAGQASKFKLKDGATLHQIEGSYNGKVGRFEWLVQDSKDTHRMFIQEEKINGIPTKQ